MKKELTIIIPFCNEGDRLRRTIRNLFLTSSGMAQFILVNDCSSDGIDYDDLLKEYAGQYIMLSTSEPSGCAVAREVGIAACKTKYFLLMDAHMGFPVKHADWYKRITALCKQYPSDLLCTKSLAMNEKGVITMEFAHSTGAMWLPASKTKFDNLFNLRWMRDHMLNEEGTNRHFPALKVDFPNNILPVPVVMGGAYVASKSQWERLHGLNGLRGYGSDEQFISLKYWASGNRCLCITDLYAAHIYHVQHQRNYEATDHLLQSVRIVKMIFTAAQQKRLLERFFELYPNLQKVVEQTDWSVFLTENKYLQSVFADGYEDYLENIVNILLPTKNENSSK